MTEQKKKREPKKPNTVSRTLPVTVRSYYKNGKRISGYKRHSAGDASRTDE